MSTPLLTMLQAAHVLGCSQSLIRKSFMAPGKRPPGSPPPPPHIKCGRRIYIRGGDALTTWLDSITLHPTAKRRPGRPTIAEVEARKSGEAAAAAGRAAR